MSIFEAVGMAWVIFTSALATVGILYLSFIGLRVTLDKVKAGKANDVSVIKEMFKIAR
jgi:hypothetical protein